MREDGEAGAVYRTKRRGASYSDPSRHRATAQSQYSPLLRVRHSLATPPESALPMTTAFGRRLCTHQATPESYYMAHGGSAYGAVPRWSPAGVEAVPV